MLVTRSPHTGCDTEVMDTILECSDGSFSLKSTILLPENLFSIVSLVDFCCYGTFHSALLKVYAAYYNMLIILE